MKKRKNRPAILRVRWLDAMHQSEDDGSAGVMQTSVGYALENSKRCVKLAQSMIGFSDGEQAGDVLTVPRAYVTETETIAPPEPIE